MARKAARLESAGALARPVGEADPGASLEGCRERLQSIELLLVSSPRDALALARALLDDAEALHTSLRPSAGAADPGSVVRAPVRQRLDAARRWLEGAEASGAVGAEGIASLRHVVADLARAAGRRDATGLAVLRRSTWTQRAVVAAVAVVVLLAVWQVRAGRERQGADYDALFAQASQRQAAGDPAGAVEIFRKAIAALPDTERTAAAWNDMGWALYQLGRYEEAIGAFRKALMLRPVFPLARNNLDAAQRQIDLRKSAVQKKSEPAR